MFVVGDPVHLTTTWTSNTGVPVDPDTLTLAVTLPDQTVANPAPVKDGVGLYHYDYPTTQSGRHLAVWTGTGNNARVWPYEFYVDTIDSGYVISLDDAKTYLRITNTNSDDKLRLYLEAASEVVEFYRGDMIRRTYTEVYSGGDPTIYVRHTPLLSVTTLTEYVGSITYTLTNQPLGASVDAWGYTIDDLPSGRIVRRSASGLVWRFVPGVGNVTITYTTGVAVIPATVRIAAMMILEHLWENQRGPMPSPVAQAGNETTVPGINYAIPLEAIELLESTSRNPVIA
jgi:hypothetical protein